MPSQFNIILLLKLEDYMLPCFIKKYTGVECLGCGIQRALALVIDGEFVAAFFMYPAIYTLILLFFTILSRFFYTFKYQAKIINGLTILNIVIIFVNYILKIIN